MARGPAIFTYHLHITLSIKIIQSNFPSPSAMATVNILYPSGHSFDLDYYLNKHMPIVQE